MENFIDYVRICCRSGKGGAGSVHFRREKYVPRGGPDGGDGGRGGHIILRGNKQLWTLLHLKYRKHVIAEDGENGGSNLCTGKSGKDEILEVPLGTVARDAETGAIEAEITEHGQEYILLAGGRGGKGNHFFKTSTNQAPTYAQPGEPGKEAWKILELKLLADVGLVGFPNAGKSTLLSVVSAAKPEIADYPFTTLTPNLGMVKYRENYSFVMADIPGIIEGASAGKGLGLRFLRHIERNACLLFMLPVDAENIIGQYHILLNELKQYNPELLSKKRLLGISKCDLASAEQLSAIEQELAKHRLSGDTTDYVFFSSATGMGIEALKDKLWQLMNEVEPN
ncbi:MAG: GTPase ObgE [Chitinophagales bacterium]|nr:GTPase ObgE [Chitinophagales bacterium]MDW8274684.1 GTPase ObgE [Chitinophagales bacterium]